MNCVQISLMLATSVLVLVSANPGGSYNYAYNLNDPITGELQEHREAKVCNDQLIYEDNAKPAIVASRNFVAEPIIASVTSRPFLDAEFVSATPESILSSDFESSRIVATAPLLEPKLESEPLMYAARPEYAPLPKYAAPITVTAAPMLETKIAAEPLIYSAPLSKYAAPITVTAAPMLETKIAAEPLIYSAPRPKFAAPIAVSAAPILETRIAADPQIYTTRAEYAPLAKYAALPKYAPRPEYFAASPAPLTVSRPQAPIVHVQAAPTQIIKSAQLQSYGRVSTSHSHKSFVNHPQALPKIATIAPQYYAAAAPAAPEYYAPTLAAKEYHVAAPAALEYSSAAPVAWQAAPAPIAMKIANPVVRANYGTVALQQTTRPLFAPSAQYAYRSSSSPATSYQYANHWNNNEQLATAGQSRNFAASPQYYSAVYQPKIDYATASQVQNLGQYDGQEQPCEK